MSSTRDSAMSSRHRGRLMGIQGLRGLAVLMVVSVHLYELELKYSNGPRLLNRWIHFNIAGVDLFLVISGFVLTYLAIGHFGDRAYLRSYAFARVSRVYPAYIVYTALLLPIVWLQPSMINSSEGSQTNILRSLLLLPDVNLPLIPVAWTLHHELYFYVVLGAMLLLPQTQLPRAMLAWLVVTVGLVAFGSVTPRPLQGAFEKVFVNPINLEFLLGMVVALRVEQGSRQSALLCLFIGTAASIIGWAIYFRVTGDHWIDPYWRVIIFGVPASLIVYGIVVLELRSRWIFASTLTWIGDAAYSIYLTHLMSMSIIGKLWRAIGIGGWAAHGLFLVVCVVVGLGVGKLCFLYIEQPLLRFTRRFEPGRVRTLRPVASE